MALPPEVVPLVRSFAANSFKFLFRRGDNVADLLRWREPAIAKRIDFAAMQAQPDTFVSASFAALESDVLLRAPLRAGRRRGEVVEVFVLIENQSEPDEMMPFRVLHYVVLVYEQQARRWSESHSNLRDFRFHAVLPVVFYSGTRTWEGLPSFRSLVHEGELFGARIPEIEPLFIGLARTEAGVLQSDVGMLGWVLWLTQQSKRKRAEFGDVLRQVVGRLDTLPQGQRERWEQLLWFAHALVYHEREGGERDQCVEYIRETVRASRKVEVSGMGKSIAETLKDEARLEEKRATLLRQLRVRFKTVPEGIETRIQASQDTEQLNAWLDAVVVARKLSDIPFNGQK